MSNPKFNDLLKWGIENSEVSRNDPNAPKNPNTQLDPQTLQEILSGMSGPSDADMMKYKMEVITHPDATLEQKVLAFEDFEMMIQGIDNANNLEPLKLWKPLIDQLEHEEADLRKYAAWCAGTAVENNVKAQERVSCLSQRQNISFRVLTLRSYSYLVPCPPSSNSRPKTQTKQCAGRPSGLFRAQLATTSPR